MTNNMMFIKLTEVEYSKGLGTIVNLSEIVSINPTTKVIHLKNNEVLTLTKVSMNRLISVLEEGNLLV